MANLPFHLIRDADWDILFADSQSEDLTKTFQVRKLTCSGKEEPKWQLTALAWLSGGGIHLRKRLRFYEIDLVVDGTRSDIFFIPSTRSCTLRRGFPWILRGDESTANRCQAGKRAKPRTDLLRKYAQIRPAKLQIFCLLWMKFKAIFLPLCQKFWALERNTYETKFFVP